MLFDTYTLYKKDAIKQSIKLYLLNWIANNDKLLLWRLSRSAVAEMLFVLDEKV